MKTSYYFISVCLVSTFCLAEDDKSMERNLGAWKKQEEKIMGPKSSNIKIQTATFPYVLKAQIIVSDPTPPMAEIQQEKEKQQHFLQSAQGQQNLKNHESTLQPFQAVGVIAEHKNGSMVYHVITKDKAKAIAALELGSVKIPINLVSE